MHKILALLLCAWCWHEDHKDPRNDQDHKEKSPDNFKMFGFDDAKDKRDEVYGDRQSHLSHEVVAGGVGFEAMKKWEDHQRSKGETVNHGMAKELLVGFAGAEMDKYAETKGMSMVDRERAKHGAEKQAKHLYDEQYGGMNNYDPEHSRRHHTMDY